LLARADWKWMLRATTSLPVPDSRTAPLNLRA